MRKNPEGLLTDYTYTQNRELSWLRFNQRVLEEAADETVPLLERMKFIAIFSSNLDEFFMVRVGSLLDMAEVSPRAVDSKSGMDPFQQLKAIYDTVPGLLEIKGQLYQRVSTLLAREEVQDLEYKDLTAQEKGFAAEYFQSVILPILSPQIVGIHHPSPHLMSKALYLSALLRNKNEKKSLGFISVPSSLPSLVVLPGTKGRFLRMETILRQWAPTLFGNYKVEETCLICATRNADLSFDMEKFEDNQEDFRLRMTKLLKKRAKQSIVRLEVNQKPSQAMIDLLTGLFPVENDQVYYDPTPLNMGYVYDLEKALDEDLRKRLTYPTYLPRWPEDLDPAQSMIQQIQRKDRLLFFPYDSVDPFLRLLGEASERPDVVSIKITIYRLASTSKIARILCRAAENGKEVVVLMELRARFDEANNIAWSKMLEEAGCKVIYGIENFKCHSKLCLITLQDKGGTHYITQVGTGNYNEKTSALYTDLSVMTASPVIGEDSAAFFRNMLTDNLEGVYQSLLVAPNALKDRICQHMDEEIAKGEKGYICIKANSITERDVIDKFYEASQAGVKVELIIRGICCLRPEVLLKTENIHITSIVGRYLEHARIYAFGRGKEARYYIASADLMTRNLQRRVEIACPIWDEEIKEQLRYILDLQLRDTAKASFLQASGTYRRKEPGKLPPLDCQQELMKVSVHRPEPMIPPQEKMGLLRQLLAWIKKF
ncbi:MAG: polyphosphate kinase 1 [Ruminiclostridium sp.]|nr:polyphosphate kinase 1 [Ruminiclostridium sp.]